MLASMEQRDVWLMARVENGLLYIVKALRYYCLGAKMAGLAL
jgi:hypothetical protein